jgi:dephospho-CoA kinase
VPVLGLTGGVAAGKSTFARAFLRDVPEMEHIDLDRCVHELLATDASIRSAVVSAFGSAILGSDGWPDRLKLRESVFADDARRHALEAILHPAVRERWMAAAVTARAKGSWLLVDIPLLYETGAAAAFDRVIVVAASRETQLRRMISERGLAPGLASNIISAQLPLGEKIQQADHVIWNDSTVSNLDGQSRLLAAWLKRKFA